MLVVEVIENFTLRYVWAHNVDYSHKQAFSLTACSSDSLQDEQAVGKAPYFSERLVDDPASYLPM